MKHYHLIMFHLIKSWFAHLNTQTVYYMSQVETYSHLSSHNEYSLHEYFQKFFLTMNYITSVGISFSKLLWQKVRHIAKDIPNINQQMFSHIKTHSKWNRMAACILMSWGNLCVWILSGGLMYFVYRTSLTLESRKRQEKSGLLVCLLISGTTHTSINSWFSKNRTCLTHTTFTFQSTFRK